MSRLEVIERMKECEANGEFDKHVDPINYDNMIKVDEDFHYIKKGFFEKLKVFLHNVFIIKPFTWYINKFVYRSKASGRENLKGVKSAIVTCNHVNMFDCLVVKKALRGHNVFVTAAEFNNQKGFLGEMMRSGGLLPLSDNYQALKNYNVAVEKLLKKNKYVMFYPEQAMWWNYEKPRPFKNGAFHYAVKHTVPVIPVFITYEERNKKNDEGIPLKKFIVNISAPIYPNVELTRKEQIEELKTKNFEVCKGIYEKFYNKPLKYEAKNN